MPPNLAPQSALVAVGILSSGRRSVEETLKRDVGDVAPGLVVMGAYSHSRLREVIFGGVTQAMLETAGFPIFSSH
ncbi:hypothetical protein RHSP_54621 [Rhizobium freirei PRF 81]|uniref:UspA domain-containing protein n=1 Tax=Rhizobium freirei PRF 81 TaxID=363754 RepID=N6V2C2_9HYPH|nr:hypothetical protein RHSP_54621 [Rhizobium freirei PRF 81]